MRFLACMTGFVLFILSVFILISATGRCGDDDGCSGFFKNMTPRGQVRLSVAMLFAGAALLLLGMHG